MGSKRSTRYRSILEWIYTHLSETQQEVLSCVCSENQYTMSHGGQKDHVVGHEWTTQLPTLPVWDEHRQLTNLDPLPILQNHESHHDHLCEWRSIQHQEQKNHPDAHLEVGRHFTSVVRSTLLWDTREPPLPWVHETSRLEVLDQIYVQIGASINNERHWVVECAHHIGIRFEATTYHYRSKS